ncbi:aspartyl protease [Lentilactobacillus fungorum]|uniref:Aspartyl protease n=1 Tax=Lentilactobacillus fungorum TaxID=2201250 RepID=A0ABQ3VY37_9LACO|nr:S53 family peptidase [Lentilactobacillus fungorum]GHP13313.1 aspartyl protease [Lentilactobacillus fungorum]
MKKWGKLLTGSLLVALAVFIWGRASIRVQADPISQAYSGMVEAGQLKPQKVKPKSTITFDIILRPRNFAEMQSDAFAVNTPGSQQFKQYLSPVQIRDKFGQPTAVTSEWTRYLKKFQLKARSFSSGLAMTVTGKVRNVDKAFKVDVNQARYHANPVQFGSRKPAIPNSLVNSVETITGLADHNQKYIFPDTNLQFAEPIKGNDNSQTGYTSRFTTQYDVTPLYQQGLTGKGQTIGIITFGGVQSEPITHFWQHENASTAAGRLSIKVVQDNIFNSDETDLNNNEATMDVEYAGSVAPEANIRLYQNKSAFPTLENVVNAYSTAYDENRASALSCSWSTGPNQYYDFLIDRKVMTPKYVDVFNLLMAQGALQGISSFIGSGDTGAPRYSVRGISQGKVMLDRTVSVSDPFGTSPYVTSVGGTTLPFTSPVAPGQAISVTKERSWGADYHWPTLQNNPSLLTETPGMLTVIGTGGGGGFGHLYPTPAYQQNVPGINTFNARQYLSFLGQPIFDQPLISGNDSGRNYPDISADADPATGHAVYFGQGKSGRWLTAGGTSIVGPQMAGVAALINSQAGRQRMGLWNPQLYELAQQADSPMTPLNDTMDNSNLYYTGQPNTVYNQASGLGTVDFAKLASLYK